MGGTHLTEKYFNLLLVSYVCDAQNHNFPIALAFMDLKNKDSLTLFLVQLRDGIVSMGSDVYF